jgi:hypothetical protein
VLLTHSLASGWSFRINHADFEVVHSVQQSASPCRRVSLLAFQGTTMHAFSLVYSKIPDILFSFPD